MPEEVKTDFNIYRQTALVAVFKIDIAFYSYKCGGMATGRTCPSEQNERLNISGTRLREMFANKETIPAEFSRPEVVAVLQRYYDNLSQVG